MKNWDCIQPQPPLDKWDAYLKPLYTKLNTVQLAETNLFVLDTHHREFVNKWAFIYDTLLERGIWRDQIVYSYAMVVMEDKVEDIDPNAKMDTPEACGGAVHLTSPGNENGVLQS